MVSFVYRLTGHGWSQAIISDGDTEATMSEVSYLSDALGDLVRAIIMLLEGGKRAEFEWILEPDGYYNLLFTQHKQLFSIRITRYRHHHYYTGSNDRGKPVLKLRCPLRDFAAAVLAQLTDLYTTLGPKGYKEQWLQHDFPLNEYKRLAALLDAEEIARPTSSSL